MNKKGQLDEIELGPLTILGMAGGAIMGWIVSSRMGSGIVLRILATVICAGACYFIASKVDNNM